MPSVSIRSPLPNFVVPEGQLLHVAGIATGTGGVEPVLIMNVLVSIDGAASVDATLKIVPHQTVPTVNFDAHVAVPDVPGTHTVTVTAVDDNNVRATSSVQVLRGVTDVVPPPAIIIDIEPPFQASANDPTIQDLVSTVQQSLVHAAGRLNPASLVLAGPAVIAATDASGIAILRLGVWVLPQGFHVVPPSPPQFPLPTLTPTQAQAGLAPIAPLHRGHRSGFTDLPFGVRVPETTLQHLVDVARQELGDSRVHSITVKLTEPNKATTHVSGSYLEIGFSVDITETLSVTKLAGADPPQSIPQVTSSHSSGIDNILLWLVGALVPIFDAILLYGSVKLAQGTDQLPGVVSGLVAGVPARVPIRNTSLPAQAQAAFKFPQVVLNWTSFGVNAGAVEGAGDAIIAERQQPGVRLNIVGPSSLNLPPGEQDIATTYNLELVEIRPDPGRLTWRLHPPKGKDDTGTADAGPLSQSAAIDLDFLVPLHTGPGAIPFHVTADALETCGTDPTKTLTASATTTVNVKVPGQSHSAGKGD